MHKTIIILVLATSALVLASVCLVQYRQNSELKASLASLRNTLRTGTPTPGDLGVGTAAVKRPDLPAQVPDAPQEVAGVTAPPVASGSPVVAPAAVTATPAAAAAPTDESPLAGFAGMVKNPAMRDMIRAQQKGHMDMIYGALFKYLQFSGGDLDALKALLLDRQMALVDLSLGMMDSAATPASRKAAADRIKEVTADYDARIKEFLGDENYAVYQSFEATQPDRMQVTLYKGTLNAADALTEEQEDNLIRAMHDARTNFSFSVAGFGDKQGMDPEQLTPELISKLLAEQAKLQEQYTVRAATILTPSQLEQFKASQKQQQAMQEMGMKMAAKMFGQRGRNPSGDGQ